MTMALPWFVCQGSSGVANKRVCTPDKVLAYMGWPTRIWVKRHDVNVGKNFLEASAQTSFHA
jgi:hypothetical protein